MFAFRFRAFFFYFCVFCSGWQLVGRASPELREPYREKCGDVDLRSAVNGRGSLHAYRHFGTFDTSHDHAPLRCSEHPPTAADTKKTQQKSPCRRSATSDGATYTALAYTIGQFATSGKTHFPSGIKCRPAPILELNRPQGLFLRHVIFLMILPTTPLKSNFHQGPTLAQNQ